MAQRVGRGIALLFQERDTRVKVSSTPRPHFTTGKDPAPILQEAEWAPGPVWTGGKSRPHWDSIPDRPARSSVAIPTELPYSYTIRTLLQDTADANRFLSAPCLRNFRHLLNKIFARYDESLRFEETNSIFFKQQEF